MNLTHLNSHEEPEPLEPGHWYRVSVRLKSLAHALPAGHHWRLALAPAYWPLSWPSPEPVTISLRTGQESRLILPVRLPRAEDGRIADFQGPEGARPMEHETLEKPGMTREIKQDIVSGLRTIEHSSTYGRVRLKNNMETDGSSLDVYTINDHDPCSAAVRCERTYTMTRGKWRTRVEVSSRMTSTRGHFRVISTLEAFKGDSRICHCEWDFEIPRDLV
ncbi:MAG: hypothetical protein JRD68_07640 [Deltaproteobacteria bacterium]|nr:hypothetical protein [Deltaproteobacteria bacterium]